MYYLEGKPLIFEQATQLTQAVLGADAQFDQSYYRDFLEHVAPGSLRSHLSQDLFLYDRDDIQRFTTHYLGDHNLTDLRTEFEETPLCSMVDGMKEVEKALHLMSQLDEGLHATFKSFIHTLFYHRSADSGGGSTSTLPGVIWCCNRRDWSSWDVLEFLIHELTHNLVFIDEYYHVHYPNIEEIEVSENYALSAVLKRPRPLDKVFHSLVVAHEVLQLRRRFNEPEHPMAHPRTPILLEQCRCTIKSLEALLEQKPDLVSERVKALILKIKREID